MVPWQALAMAVRTKRLARADVERETHVKTVKGLKRNLGSQHRTPIAVLCTHPAATATLLQPMSFRVDVKTRDTTDCPLWAICRMAYADSRSTAVYTRFVAKGWDDGSGRRANSGRRRGACSRLGSQLVRDGPWLYGHTWWYTPPS